MGAGSPCYLVLESGDCGFCSGHDHIPWDFPGNLHRPRHLDPVETPGTKTGQLAVEIRDGLPDPCPGVLNPCDRRTLLRSGLLLSKDEDKWVG